MIAALADRVTWLHAHARDFTEDACLFWCVETGKLMYELLPHLKDPKPDVLRAAFQSDSLGFYGYSPGDRIFEICRTYVDQHGWSADLIAALETVSAQTHQNAVGLMGDLTWPGMQSVLTAGAGGASATVTSHTNMSWTLAARLGWLATPSTLLYALGGYTNQSVTTTGYAGHGRTIFSSEDRLSGFTVGPGFEVMIAKGWSTRLEYRYSQFETRTLLSGVTMQPSSHTVRAGLAYRFGVN